MESPASTQSGVTRCGRFVSYAAITLERLTCSFPNAVGQSVPSVSIGSSSVSARPPRCHLRSTRTCFAMPAGSSSRMNGHDTRALQHYLGHKNIEHTVRYTDMAHDRFKDFWRG